MTGTTKVVRLSKAAKEFNIGRDTIVSFLAEKGFVIDRNPNTKLTDEMFSLLTDEFYEDKQAMEAAAQRELEYVGKETISIKDDSFSKEEKKPEDNFQEELIITGVGISFPSPKADKKVEKTEEPKKKETVPEAEKQEPVKEETAAPVGKTIEKAEKPLPESEEKPEKEEAQTTVPVSGKADAEKDEKKGELKVVGKVDLDSLNQKTRPTKRSKAAKAKKEAAVEKAPKPKVAEKEPPLKEKEEVVNKEAAKKEPAKEAPEKAPPPVDKKEKDSNFIKTKVEKLAGLKVVDKIDLPLEVKHKKRKPAASSSDKLSGQKKKRKRIRSKPQTGVPPAVGAGERRGRKDRPGSKRVAKPELTEEQIQKQIKETLARLAPSGKSKASKYRRQKRDSVSQSMQEEIQRQEEEKGILKVTEFVTANELASMMNVGVNEIIKICMQLGMFVSINQRLDAETISLVSEEFGFQVEFVGVDDSENLDIEDEADDPESLVGRAPIVTVMGHVDHGKTKLLDYIRKENVVAGEAGGITQHIGAYEVVTESGKSVTFLDTPGHEAFTAMRARGAKVTDIAIIVIAADDSVMPQTKEAINHAQAAGVPIVFAFNKMDKPGANSDKIKDQLSQMNILVEDWGGKFQSQEISAITGMGISDLLEKVLLEAEMLDLKANPDKPGKGTVIEALLDKGRGYVATLLVRDGTMKKGDIVLAGPVFGKVKAMFNERNKPVSQAGPSQPVVMLGLTAAPQAGDVFNIMKEEKEAKQLASKRLQLTREQNLRTQKHITLDEIGRRLAIGDFKELNIIVKGDVDGSIEALTDALLKLSTEEVQVNVIHKAVGAITESDVMLASASDAIIIGFQVRPIPLARKLAEKEQIDIRLYSIIYQATEELTDAIKGMHAPKMEEKITCNIEVRETFKITKVGTIAGCYVLDGKVTRNTKVRVIRDGIVVYTGNLGSLKRFKDDVKEVATGYECGLNIENFNDIKVGDIVEGYTEVEVSR
ncbi:MAG: translation initiation factor IF-2 [Bacteroidales bacterium]|nr:translation initiation factor IF-2 [Bacteroidales bacterium]